MKTVYSKIVFLAAAFFTLFAMSVGAQTLPSDNTQVDAIPWVEFGLPTQYPTPNGEAIDLVTAGSVMPYRVDTEAVFTLPALPSFSFQYKWQFSPTPALSIYAIPTTQPTNIASFGTAITPVEAGTNWYTQDKIAVHMNIELGTDAYRDITMNTNLRYYLNGAVVCTEPLPGTDRVSTIRIVPPPKAEWKVVDGQPLEWVVCVGQDATVPTANLLVEGNGDFEVKYSISFTPFPNDTKTADPTFLVDEWVALTATGTAHAMTFDKALFDGPGVYDFVITDVTDRISRKSLIHVPGTVQAAAAQTPFKIFVLPDPAEVVPELPVEHVRNNP